MSELRRLMETAIEQLDAGVSTVDFEDSFERVLDYIKRHPEVRETAEALFIETLNRPLAPIELITFCMHELRWQSVREAAKVWLENAPRRHAYLSNPILDAYEDDWDERDLYAYYDGQGPRLNDFNKLMDTAIEQLNAGVSVADFEVSFEWVLYCIKRRPEIRQTAEALFIGALDSTDPPIELIAFCMHELRWQSVREAAKVWLETAPRRHAYGSNPILDAYEDDWDERDLYDYYNRRDE